MTKIQIIRSGITLGLLVLWLSIPLNEVVAVDYLPTENDLPDYHLLWGQEISIGLDWYNSEELNGAAQIWYKNDSSNTLVSVIGLIIADAKGYSLFDPLPCDPANFFPEGYEELYKDVEKWWDLFVVLMPTQLTGVVDITSIISFTDGSMQFEVSTEYFPLYMILSADSDYLFWTFAFEISDIYWLNNSEEIVAYFEYLIDAFCYLTQTFNNCILMCANSVLDSFHSPEASATYTAKEEVISFTQTLGELYPIDNSVPGYSSVAIGGIISLFIVCSMQKMRKKVKIL